MNELGHKLSLTLVALADALSRCWEHSEYRGKRPREGILDQEVDKFALLLMQCWPRQISPFLQVPGRHGPGPALPKYGDAGGYLYVCDVVELFQQQVPAENLLFEVSPGFGPWRHFVPRMGVTQRERWVRDHEKELFPDYDRFLSEFTAIVRELTPEQIVALGRHPSAADTAKALQTLSTQLAGEIGSMLKHSTDPELWWRHISSANTVAKVIHEKAISDRVHYTDARRLVSRQCDGEAKKAILGKRGGSDEIWEHPDVVPFVGAADRLFAGVKLVWVASFLGLTKCYELPAPGTAPSNPEQELEQSLTKWSVVRESDVDLGVKALKLGDFSSAKPLVQDEMDRILFKLGLSISGKVGVKTNVA